MRSPHREEQLTDLVEPFQRVVRTVVGPVAVGPLVVAGCVHQRIDEAVELRADGREVLIAAHRRARLDVADVRHPIDVRVSVDLVDHVREVRQLKRTVRRVADDSERGHRRRRRRRRDSAGINVIAGATPPRATTRETETRPALCMAGTFSHRDEPGPPKGPTAAERIVNISNVADPHVFLLGRPSAALSSVQVVGVSR